MNSSWEDIVSDELNIDLTAFNYFDIDKVKVVWIIPHRRDPNNNFVFNNLRLCNTLSSIYDELEKDTGIKNNNPDLTQWCEQGILFLHTTVVNCEDFKTLLQNIINKNKNVAWVLMNDFINNEDFYHDEYENIMDIWKDEFVLKTTVPQPHFLQNNFLGSKIFSKINNHFREKEIKEIDWELPNVNINPKTKYCLESLSKKYTEWLEKSPFDKIIITDQEYLIGWIWVDDEVVSIFDDNEEFNDNIVALKESNHELEYMPKEELIKFYKNEISNISISCIKELYSIKNDDDDDASSVDDDDASSVNDDDDDSQRVYKIMNSSELKHALMNCAYDKDFDESELLKENDLEPYCKEIEKLYVNINPKPKYCLESLTKKYTKWLEKSPFKKIIITDPDNLNGWIWVNDQVISIFENYDVFFENIVALKKLNSEVEYMSKEELIDLYKNEICDISIAYIKEIYQMMKQDDDSDSQQDDEILDSLELKHALINCAYNKDFDESELLKEKNLDPNWMKIENLL